MWFLDQVGFIALINTRSVFKNQYYFSISDFQENEKCRCYRIESKDTTLLGI